MSEATNFTGSDQTGRHRIDRPASLADTLVSCQWKSDFSMWSRYVVPVIVRTGRKWKTQLLERWPGAAEKRSFRILQYVCAVKACHNLDTWVWLAVAKIRRTIRSKTNIFSDFLLSKKNLVSTLGEKLCSNLFTAVCLGYHSTFYKFTAVSDEYKARRSVRK